MTRDAIDALVATIVMALIAFLVVCVARAEAHTAWANGDPIPSWIKSSCCGPADAHHLRPDQVYDHGDYYVVEGYHGNGGKISHQAALPSQDGEYWVFYRDDGPNGQTGVYCFFVPMDL